MHKRRFLISILAIGLYGCVAPSASPDLAALNEPKLHYTTGIAPPGAKPGTCWGRSASPAVIETVTEQILLQPAEVLADGTVVQPAVYKTETLQKIVKKTRVFSNVVLGNFKYCI